MRSLAQQQLHLDPNLELKAMEYLQNPKDAALEEMLAIVKACIPKKGDNPYYQACRDSYAVDNHLFYHIEKADIIMVLDKSGEVIAFQCCQAIRLLLSTTVEASVVQGFETYSTIHAVPTPDATRHGLHWIEWLAEHPGFDFRVADNNLREAKSGVYHIGGHCMTGDSGGNLKGVMGTLDTAPTRIHVKNWPQLVGQQEIFQYSVLGACTAVLTFFFKIPDPTLFAEYEKVAAEVRKTDVNWQTRHDESDPFIMNAVLINLMTTDHKDKSDWTFGFAALLPVGNFTGGDLLFRELGLRIESPPGCAEFMRGREFSHSITKWSGRRSVVVCVTHEAVRKWAQRIPEDQAALLAVAEAKKKRKQGSDAAESSGAKKAKK